MKNPFQKKEKLIAQDLELVKACAAGDQIAWNNFVEQYHTSIQQAILATLKRYGVADNRASLAADLFQDVFIFLKEGACSRIKQYQARGNCRLSTWLRVVTSRFVIDQLRKKKLVTVTIDAIIEKNDRRFQPELTDPLPLADHKLETHETIAHIKRIIASLPAKDQLIISLIFEEELPIADVAEIVKIKPGALYTRISRIRKTLRCEVNL